MADFYSNKITSATAHEPARTGVGVQSITAYAALSSAPAAGDKIHMFYLPKDAVVLEVYLDSDDLDTNASPTITLDVGTSSSANAFIAASTVAQGGGIDTLDPQKRGALMSADTEVIVTVNAGPATGAAGDVALTCIYTCQPQDAVTWTP